MYINLAYFQSARRELFMTWSQEEEQALLNFTQRKHGTDKTEWSLPYVGSTYWLDAAVAIRDETCTDSLRPGINMSNTNDRFM